MKLKDLKDILWTQRGTAQGVIVYDWNKGEDLIFNCSPEYAVKTFGDYTVRRICSCTENEQDYIVIEVL